MSFTVVDMTLELDASWAGQILAFSEIILLCKFTVEFKVEGSSIEEAVASAIAMGATKDQVCLH